MSKLRLCWSILDTKRPGDKLLELWGRRSRTRDVQNCGRKGVGISDWFGGLVDRIEAAPKVVA